MDDAGTSTAEEVNRTAAALRREGLDFALLSSPPNVTYAAGFEAPLQLGAIRDRAAVRVDIADARFRSDPRDAGCAPVVDVSKPRDLRRFRRRQRTARVHERAHAARMPLRSVLCGAQLLPGARQILPPAQHLAPVPSKMQAQAPRRHDPPVAQPFSDRREEP